MKNHLSQNIKTLRSKSKLTQEQLSKKLRITRQRLRAYEENRNEPPIKILVKLSTFFYVPIDQLIKTKI